ncbi:hypothetical protein DFAR_670019 [Desulfarculales bacterium]
MIALLLLKWPLHLSLAVWSLSNLTATLRLNFFTYRELRVWLYHSYHTPPFMPDQVQLPLLPADSREVGHAFHLKRATYSGDEGLVAVARRCWCLHYATGVLSPVKLASFFLMGSPFKFIL